MAESNEELRQSSMEQLNVQNLDYAEYLDMPVFTQRTIITSQPIPEANPNRRPIPISTLDWRSTNVSQMVPPSGIDFLRGTNELLIQQTVELVDILAYVESENRFLVKVPRGETLYLGAETSSKAQRLCFASNRSFELKLFDPSHQEALSFNRKLACNNWLFGCCLQELLVYSDKDVFVGSVKQEWQISAPLFALKNSEGQIIYRMLGPPSAAVCCGNNYHAKFEVLNAHCTTKLGHIVHDWDILSSDYNLTVTFPTADITTEMKAVILGAAFLLEYMYFETSKRRGMLTTLTCGVC